MPLNRRDILKNTLPVLAGGALLANPAQSAEKNTYSAALSIGDYGLEPGAKQVQTSALQKAMDAAAESGRWLILPGGVYLTETLTLPSGLMMAGAGAATVLRFAGGGGFVSAKGGNSIILRDLTFDGASKPVAGENAGLLRFDDVKGLALEGCRVTDSLGNGISLTGCGGHVSRCMIRQCGSAGLFALDSAGLEISHNDVTDCSNNGILVWRSQKGKDGTLVAHNRIARIKAEAGGSGQNGNGINVYRAGNVLVSSNVIEECAYSAVRNNSGDNVQILNNNCRALGEVALYAEFSFEGAVINNNLVDGAHVGISITNFNEGGRLATATGNLIRNIKARGGQKGIGIGVEADTVVTGNCIEAVEGQGIGIGFGKYMRQVTANNNLIRGAEIGIGVSTHNEAGFALIATNMITGAKNGAVRAMDENKPLGPDLSKTSSEAFRNLAIYGNVSV